MRGLKRLFTTVVAALLLAFLSVAGVYLYLEPRLPSIEHLKRIQLQVPLRVFARDGALIGEFGEKRRIPVQLEQVPALMVQAFLAAEDDRFFEHPGVDYQGIVRAGLELVRTGEKRQGGSTITMQVARNFFLSREKTYLRKLNEILLALKIERELSKAEILELYLNKIYLGNRAYGVGAAAKGYYGSGVDQLGLAQVAMIAGLPKAPSRYNPIADPDRALIRRNYVLRRMLTLGSISPEQYQQALTTPVTADLHQPAPEVEAPFVAEMVRGEMVRRFGEDAYSAGFRVITTLDPTHQSSANRALRNTLLEYDRRHGYRGPERRARLPEASATPEELEALIGQLRPIGGLQAAVVIAVAERSAQVWRTGGLETEIPWSGLEWAAPAGPGHRPGPGPKRASEVLAPGDVVRIVETDSGWMLAQVPTVAGAFVAIEPNSGATTALIGGFDFYESKFNRVTQAMRQPGSGFKPVIYAAALDAGFTPASIINDAPVVFDDPALEASWRPENYSGRSHGPTRMRVGLTNSRNLVSIRLLRAVGIDRVVDYARHFGFESGRLPRDLSLALGSAAVRPLELAQAYCVLANGGFAVTPYFIEEIRNGADESVFRANPAVVCRDCEIRDDAEAIDLPPQTEPSGDETPRYTTSPAPLIASRAISPQVQYLLYTMLQDVVTRGTGRRARALGRRDIAGKTGTTNDQRDAWFNGFNPNLVAVAWVGFDDSRPLGDKETGARAALPMWMRFMAEALDGAPEATMEEPEGLVRVRIDPKTGLLARTSTAGAVFEIFREENVPRGPAAPPLAQPWRRNEEPAAHPAPNIREQIF